MAFAPSERPIPEELRTDEFALRPLRTTDVDLDFAAVVESRASLRALFGGSWPREGFTVEENLQDLEIHEREHVERKAFTFTVVNPEETECLGCIYVTPLAFELEHAGADEAVISGGADDDAAVFFWVRSSRVADGLEERVLRSVAGWLRESWPLGRVLFGANEHAPRRAKQFAEIGLRERIRVARPTKGTALLFFE